jgi:signal transduction histidine kinase
MHGLRSKILVGFGGLLLMLVAVSFLSGVALNRYSREMQQSFKEDYQSVKSCEDLAHTAYHIDAALRLSLQQDQPIDRDDLESSRKSGDEQLETQRAIATLPGEREATDRLSARWNEYKLIYTRVVDNHSYADRRAEYSRLGLSKAIEVQAAAHELIDMNMTSMLSVHSRVREMASHFRWIMHVLTASAILLSVCFALLIGRFILRPVRILTDSVGEIERGNLEFRVPILSRDELGMLGAAVNAMAAQLQAYRQADHDRLVRTEGATQLAIDSLPDAVIVVNPAGRIEIANEAAKQLFHLTPGASVADKQTPWLAELHQQICRSGHASTPSGYESTIQVDDHGDTRFFLPRTIPITGENQQPIGTTVVLADVTGLRRLDEMKNGLLALVSHELKTPLTGLRMVLHLVTDQRVGPLAPKQKELLDSARDDAERLHSIVDNLLDMARIESGRALMELQPVSPATLAAGAAESLRGAFESQQVTLSIAATHDLPLASADPTRISHVLINLLYNSLRHTPSGGHVRIWARAVDDWIEMGVTDDGAGIARQNLPRIFEKFFRAPGQRGAGSGLGLSIAKDIVEAHGGQIRAESAEEKGSTISFTLKRADVAANAGAERVELAR